MPIELKPCNYEDCQHFRLWYRTGMTFYQKAMENPGMPDTREFCALCGEFNRFNLYTPKLREGHGDK